MKSKIINSYQILGCKVSDCTTDQLNDYILSIVQQNKKEMVLNVNINCINLAQKNQWLKDLLNKTNIVFCDGDGVRIGAKIKGIHIPEKITYNRWIWQLAELSAKNKLSWFLFGGKDEVVKESSTILSNKYLGLNISGYHSGYFDFSKDSKEIIEQINKAKPNILVLGMGMPRQEKWIIKNFDKLDVNIVLTGGAVFDYITGKAKMTPDFYYKYKIEWLYRFINDPVRLFSRYILGNPVFLFRVLLEKLKIRNYNVSASV